MLQADVEFNLIVPSCLTQLCYLRSLRDRSNGNYKYFALRKLGVFRKAQGFSFLPEKAPLGHLVRYLNPGTHSGVECPSSVGHSTAGACACSWSLANEFLLRLPIGDPGE